MYYQPHGACIFSADRQSKTWLKKEALEGDKRGMGDVVQTDRGSRNMLLVSSRKHSYRHAKQSRNICLALQTRLILKLSRIVKLRFTINLANYFMDLAGFMNSTHSCMNMLKEWIPHVAMKQCDHERHSDRGWMFATRLQTRSCEVWICVDHNAVQYNVWATWTKCLFFYNPQYKTNCFCRLVMCEELVSAAEESIINCESCSLNWKCTSSFSGNCPVN